MTTQIKMATLADNTRAVGSSAYWGDNGDWLIASAMHRDSDCLTCSNFRCFEKALKALPEFKAWDGEFSPVTIEEFNHWAVGWVQYLIIHPSFTAGVALAESIRAKLEEYPVLDDEDFSNIETEEANETWKNCYDANERIKYIRDHKSQFEFHDFADMLGCIRGKYFAGYASELITR